LLFGVKAYANDGALDRKFIGDIVFNNPQMLSRLNYIVHPAVKRHSADWAKGHKKAAYTLKEAALLIESGNHKAMNKIIVVTAPLDVRVDRVMKRDSASKEEVMARENKQMSEAKKIELADFIINNDGNTSLVQQVHKIHQTLVG
jgi:dephospho-CoA kinase